MDPAATSNDEQQIRKAIDNYVVAMERGDPQLWESLFWLDDPALSIVENDRPHLLGREYVDFLTGLIGKRGPHPSGQKWYETRVHFLSTSIAYTTSLRDETFSGGIVKTSRVTLVFKKKDDQWRIIHGHFSFVPE